EVSFLGAHGDEINTVTLDDPELFKYPIAYIIEVGWWTDTDREAAGLRGYLQKGGLLLVDDFKPAGWRVPGGGREQLAEARRLGRRRGRHPARIQECPAVSVIKRAERMTDPCGGIRRTAHDLSRIWFRCRSGLLYDSDTH